MQIKKIATSKINPATYNPRKDLKPGDPAYEQLVKSLDAFGAVQPLDWNKRTGTLVGGHQRFKVLLARGDKAVDVSVVDLDDAREKALNIALNKVSGEWDTDLLGSLLADLQDAANLDLDLEATGFSLAEIENLLPSLDDEPEPDANVDASGGEAVTQPGDLIELGLNGEHRLLCGDVLDPDCIQRLLGDRRARVCHTDPPYGVSYDPRNRPGSCPRPRDGGSAAAPGSSEGSATTSGCSGGLIANDDLTPEKYRKWIAHVIEVIDSALLPGASFYIWNAHRQFGLMHDLLTDRKHKVRSTIVWAKESFSPGFGDYQEQVEFCLYGSKKGGRHRWRGPKNASTLWRVSRERRDVHNHPTQKPLELAERAIRHASDRGDLVFDPFLGSGTTLIAAARLGRHSAGLEIEPRHCDTIVRRYIALAGENAVSPEVAARYRLATEEVTS